ncbi:mitochondrial carrier protein [Ditylenchus destructor]|nr:mitochondrial carrier protein [Ditylenchus destructor]
MTTLARDPGISFLAGSAGGMCKVLVGHPFETVKIRLQTMPISLSGESPLYRGSLDCCRKTVSREGFLALYKGVTVPLAAGMPLSAIYFGGCGLGKMIRHKHAGDKLTFLDNFLIGFFAGGFTSLLGSSAERLRSVLQIQSNNAPQYTGPIDVVRKLKWSLFRGTAANIIKGAPSGGIYMSAYDTLKRFFSGVAPLNSIPSAPILVAGGCAGMAVGAICLPLDIIKSRVQTAPAGKYPHGVRSAVKELYNIYRIEGINYTVRTCYRGIVPVLIRTFPCNAACFGGVELILFTYRLSQNDRIVI